MEFMKANRKFKMDEDDAVSAVIGVILMVAITVAIAATVYVYVSGMIGSSPQSAPSMQFVKDDISDKLTVASADPGDLTWDQFAVIIDNSEITDLRLHASGNIYVWNTSATPDAWYLGGSEADMSDVDVNAGDYFNMTTSDSLASTTPLAIRHTDTNTLIGTWDFN